MTYRDFAGATVVFDRYGRSGALIFDEDPAGESSVHDGAGWVAYQVRTGGSGIEPVSVRTTWVQAQEVLGSLYNGAYAGPNIPAGETRYAADLDQIIAKLSKAGLLS